MGQAFGCVGVPDSTLAIRESWEKFGQAFGCVCVPDSTLAIRESWKKFDRVLVPGLHCVPWCIGITIAGYVNLRVQQFLVVCKSKTKDDVFVTVIASIQYRAMETRPSEAFYKLANPKEQIKSYAYDAIRASFSKLILADAIEKRNEIAKAVKKEFKEAMSKYGYEIIQTMIVDVKADQRVERAMNESIAVKLHAESMYQIGLGTARQRRAIVDGLCDSVLAFSKDVPGTNITTVMDVVLATQYIDTMKEIGAQSKSCSVSISNGAGAVKDVATQIRGQVEKKE